MLLPLSCTLLGMIPLSCDQLHTSKGRDTALNGAAPTLLFVAAHLRTYEHSSTGAVMSTCTVGRWTDPILSPSLGKPRPRHLALRIRYRVAAYERTPCWETCDGQQGQRWRRHVPSHVPGSPAPRTRTEARTLHQHCYYEL